MQGCWTALGDQVGAGGVSVRVEFRCGRRARCVVFCFLSRLVLSRRVVSRLVLSCFVSFSFLFSFLFFCFCVPSVPVGFFFFLVITFCEDFLLPTCSGFLGNCTWPGGGGGQSLGIFYVGIDAVSSPGRVCSYVFTMVYNLGLLLALLAFGDHHIAAPRSAQKKENGTI